MLLKPKDREPSEVPQRRLEDAVGEKETVIANGTTVRGRIQGPNTVPVVGFLKGRSALTECSGSAIKGRCKAR